MLLLYCETYSCMQQVKFFIKTVSVRLGTKDDESIVHISKVDTWFYGVIKKPNRYVDDTTYTHEHQEEKHYNKGTATSYV